MQDVLCVLALTAETHWSGANVWHQNQRPSLSDETSLSLGNFMLTLFCQQSQWNSSLLSSTLLVFRMTLLMSLMAYERNHTWVKLHGVTAPATSRIAMQTFMAAVHSEETIRTNCPRVQQSRPGTVIYEPNHLWVPCTRTKHRVSTCKLSYSSPTEQHSCSEDTETEISSFILMFHLISNYYKDVVADVAVSL